MVTIKPKTIVQQHVEAECPTHARTDVRVRNLTLTIDEPEERGGTNKGPAPTETAIAALLGCTNTIGHKCAHQLGITIRSMSVSAKASFDRRGVTLAEEIDVPYPEIQLRVVVESDASQADIERLGVEVAKFCPLAKIFKQAGTTLNEEWILKS
ncbi:MAG: OsmC family protein [Pseudomonadota bacterium]